MASPHACAICFGSRILNVPSLSVQCIMCTLFMSVSNIRMNCHNNSFVHLILLRITIIHASSSTYKSIHLYTQLVRICSSPNLHCIVPKISGCFLFNDRNNVQCIAHYIFPKAICTLRYNSTPFEVVQLGCNLLFFFVHLHFAIYLGLLLQPTCFLCFVGTEIYTIVLNQIFACA